MTQPNPLLAQPEDLTPNVADGQPGHAGKHNAERTHANGISAWVLTLATALNDVVKPGGLLAQKAAKPQNGFTLADLDLAGIQLVIFRLFVNGAWQPRGTDSTSVLCIWLKPTAATPNPPIGDGFMLKTDTFTDVSLIASA